MMKSYDPPLGQPFVDVTYPVDASDWLDLASCDSARRCAEQKVFLLPAFTIAHISLLLLLFSSPQNDQSTEELHIIGSRDLSFLRGKVLLN